MNKTNNLCFNDYEERFNLIEKKSIELVIVHSRTDFVFEHSFYDWQSSKIPKQWTEEWKKEFK